MSTFPGPSCFIYWVSRSRFEREIANADPVEDVFKKLGRRFRKRSTLSLSIEPEKRAPLNDLVPKNLNSVEAHKSRVEPLKSEPEATPTPAVRRAQLLPGRRGKQDMPLECCSPARKVLSPALFADGDTSTSRVCSRNRGEKIRNTGKFLPGAVE